MTDLNSWLNKNATLEDGVYLVSGKSDYQEFEEKYLEVRKKEGRVWEDEELKQLPYLPKDHPHSKEWRMRSRSFERLYRYLSKVKNLNVLDVGCGPGWLGGRLAKLPGIHYYGVDVNLTELKQGAHVFPYDNLNFLYWDVFEKTLPPESFDVILLQGSIQYFENLSKLFNVLMPMLKKQGELHILDSPIYKNPEEARKAKVRTQEYYRQLGFPEMAAHYFHHTWKELKEFDYQIIYNPDGLMQKVKRKISGIDVPFDWIRVEIINFLH